MIRNEFIEVHINEATGGIARIKQFGRQPNRLSQQLAFRFPRERIVAGPNGETDRAHLLFADALHVDCGHVERARARARSSRPAR